MQREADVPSRLSRATPPAPSLADAEMTLHASVLGDGAAARCGFLYPVALLYVPPMVTHIHTHACAPASPDSMADRLAPAPCALIPFSPVNPTAPNRGKLQQGRTLRSPIRMPYSIVHVPVRLA